MMDNTNHNMVHTFERKIEDAISRRDLLCRDGFYVVALSGGPDSVALLRVLVSLGYTVHAAHCNFHLRGEESNRDEKFCETLCKRWVSNYTEYTLTQRVTPNCIKYPSKWLPAHCVTAISTNFART